MKHYTKNDYRKYAQFAAVSYYENYDTEIAKWSKNINLENVFGYIPPGEPVFTAYIFASLYTITGKKDFAEKAVTLLSDYGTLKKYYPADFWHDRPGYENGLPALPDFFTVPIYCKTFLQVKDYNGLTKKDKSAITQNIIEGCRHQIRIQEWGAMNRGILRAEAYHLAALCLPDNELARTMNMLAKSIIDDCWSAWEVEDATNYAGVFLYSLFSLDEYYLEKDLFNEAVTRYTMQYYTYQLAPHGMLPDYGDSDLYNNWQRFVPVFEKAATEYNDPEMKYAAVRIGTKFWNLNEKDKDMWQAVLAIDCSRWADDSIEPKAPPAESRVVLEDVLGKKVVFRTGYGDKDTYLMLNYKDEGIAGFMTRKYLRETIAVEEEKMTHGHSDENDITTLMVNGSLLLHESGYRDMLPSGPFGAYRADYLHNRLVVRRDKMFKGQKKGQYRYARYEKSVIGDVPGQSVLDFVRNSGAYRQVRTELVDFLRTDKFDYARTRLHDDNKRVRYDRIVNWIKPLNIFVVFDIVEFTESDFYTPAVFWHTQHILDNGSNYYDTQYTFIRNGSFPDDTALLIYFPEGEKDNKMIGHQEEMRYYQKGYAIHQATSGWRDAGSFEVFTSVLIPHEKGADLQKLMKNVQCIETSHYPRTAGITVKNGKETYVICAKTDINLGLKHRDERPMYRYEEGKVSFAGFETDAQQFFAVKNGDSLEFTAAYAVKALYKNKILFELEPSVYGIQFDGKKERPGTGKIRYWTETINLKDLK